MLDSILIVVLVLVLFLAAFVLLRALMYGRVPPGAAVEAGAQPALPVDGPVIAEHLAAAIRAETVSHTDRSRVDYATFAALHETLERMYPRAHAALRREFVNEHSALYTWPGKADAEPVLLCAHLDVVPADPATLGEWTQPPFSGAVADGQVWGRGALDMKSVLVAKFEAIEGLLRAGYEPERTLYLALGHDEEVYGFEGAACISELLQQRGERLAAVFDEGGEIDLDGLPGVKVPVAKVGVAEKGFASLELKVEGRPGHSSMPPRHTAIGVLARAIARLEASPMPARTAMADLMFESLAPFLPIGTRIILANRWLFGGLFRRRMEASPANNAVIRTTSAVTVVQGGVKDNILPSSARAVVNFRILPGDSVEKVLAHTRKAVNDEAVQVSLILNSGWQPSLVSPVDSPAFESLAATIRSVFPEATVAPYLVTGATDSRHYQPLTGNIFRFAPYPLDSAAVRTIHGIDERISIDTLARMVQFYTRLIATWTTVTADERG